LIYLYLKHTLYTELYKVTKLLENKGYTVYSLKMTFMKLLDNKVYVHSLKI